MTTSLLLNSLGVVALRLVLPWAGVWFAEADIDPGAPLPALPPGPAIVTIGTAGALVGTFDPAAQGVFGPKAGARIVGGRGGWGRSVPPQHFHNDAQLLDELVISSTAAIVGEVAVVALPLPIGIDYVRAAGPASSVLDGYEWHVDLAGVTQVAPRLPLPIDPTSYDVITFDPVAQRVTLATDSIIQPGAILLDQRFGTLIVRDVEQTWTAEGARAECWCGSGAVSRLEAALSTFVRRKAGIAYLKAYRYRVVVQNVDGRVVLQPVNILGDVPPTLPLSVAGVAGVTATYKPGAVVYVGFLEGDPSKPRVLGVEDPGGLGKPLLLQLDALTPAGVIVGGIAPQPVAKMTALATWAAEVEAGLAASGHPVTTSFGLLPIASTKLVTD